MSIETVRKLVFKQAAKHLFCCQKPQEIHVKSPNTSPIWSSNSLHWVHHKWPAVWSSPTISFQHDLSCSEWKISVTLPLVGFDMFRWPFPNIEGGNISSWRRCMGLPLEKHPEFPFLWECLGIQHSPNLSWAKPESNLSPWYDARASNLWRFW